MKFVQTWCVFRNQSISVFLYIKKKKKMEVLLAIQHKCFKINTEENNISSLMLVLKKKIPTHPLHTLPFSLTTYINLIAPLQPGLVPLDAINHAIAGFEFEVGNYVQIQKLFI